MEAFKITKAKTAYYADDIIKIGDGATTSTAYGLNAGSIFDGELNKWMAYRDLIRHPNPTTRGRWLRAGVNGFARLGMPASIGTISIVDSGTEHFVYNVGSTRGTLKDSNYCLLVSCKQSVRSLW